VDDCLICERLALWRQGRNPYVVDEFEQCLFVVGDHQFHRGYCLLLLKEHVRELHDMPEARALAVCAEVLRASRAVTAAFRPWKMNLACYGNAEEHVHWHLMPRHADDPDRRRAQLQPDPARALRLLGVAAGTQDAGARVSAPGRPGGCPTTRTDVSLRLGGRRSPPSGAAPPPGAPVAVPAQARRAARTLPLHSHPSRSEPSRWRRRLSRRAEPAPATRSANQQGRLVAGLRAVMEHAAGGGAW
jgi:diadenosine tetraphosphate (Ap4A) HIT family hydrolase